MIGAATLLGLSQVSTSVESQTFRASSDVVAVYATVRGPDGRFVTDLPREVFEVLDNGVPVEITAFARDRLPLAVAVMLDTSQRSRGVSAVLRSDAVTALAKTLRPEDRMSVGTFGLEVTVGTLVPLALSPLSRVLREEVWKGGGTPLWQAIGDACQSLQNESGRRVVVMLTDGDDSGGTPGWKGDRKTVERDVVARGCMVHAIKQGVLNPDLAAFVETTGGGFSALPPGAEFGDALANVAEQLRHQYLLGFQPSAFDGHIHRLHVRVKSSGHHVHARRSYLAVRPPADSIVSPAVVSRVRPEDKVVLARTPDATRAVQIRVIVTGPDRASPVTNLRREDFEVVRALSMTLRHQGRRN